MRLGVLLIHGIGDQGPDWADAIIRSLEQRVLEQLRSLLDQPPLDAGSVLTVGRVHWADVLAQPQRELRRILNRAHASPTADGSWWHRLLGTVTGALRRQESRFIADFIGDVIGYRSPETRQAIYDTITRALDQLAASPETGVEQAPLTLIAHSLGSVIASDYVWDVTKAHRHQGVHDRWRFENFFTVGSPMALFALQYGGAAAFNKPIALESPRGRWVNLYDRDDPIGMPLRPLNAAYRRVVLADAEVRAGAYLLAHTRYFTNQDTLTIISRKLALDWCAQHDPRSAPRWRDLSAAYDRTLGLAGVGRPSAR